MKAGCSNCIEVCATEAIVSAGDKIKLDPYLCQGCGTCTTVCPSGALAYQLSARRRCRSGDQGAAQGLSRGWRRECLSAFHSAEAGRKQLAP
jgi:Fe-S-cluster-containing hydrogenase component 2